MQTFLPETASGVLLLWHTKVSCSSTSLGHVSHACWPLYWSATGAMQVSAEGEIKRKEGTREGFIRVPRHVPHIVARSQTDN